MQNKGGVAVVTGEGLERLKALHAEPCGLRTVLKDWALVAAGLAYTTQEDGVCRTILTADGEAFAKVSIDLTKALRAFRY